MEEAGHLVEAKSLGSSGCSKSANQDSKQEPTRQSTELFTTGDLMKGYSLGRLRGHTSISEHSKAAKRAPAEAKNGGKQH